MILRFFGTAPRLILSALVQTITGSYPFSDGWRYFDAVDGVMQVGLARTASGAVIYCTPEGIIVTGERTFYGVKYHFNDDGILVDPGTVTPIPDGGELTLSGMQKGETERAEFTYSALYEKGTPDEYSHVRVDSVTNNRPGVVLKKADWNGAPLAGAEFVLKDSSGNWVGTFVSDEQGQITVAFLSDNKEYTLKETRTPKGWHGLEEPMTILLYNGSVTVGNIEEDCYTLSQESGGTPVLTVKNRPWTFRAVKKDAEKGNALEGVKFALHRKKTVSGVTDYDLTPEPGFEELVTGTDGVIPKIDQNLPAGSYELREKAALEGYQILTNYIRFTVGPTGVISLDEQNADVELAAEKAVNADGTVAYTLTVKNSPVNMTPTPTGIHQDTKPYGWMFLLGCLLLAGAALPAVVRRRRSDQRSAH